MSSQYLSSNPIASLKALLYFWPAPKRTGLHHRNTSKFKLNHKHHLLIFNSHSLIREISTGSSALTLFGQSFSLRGAAAFLLSIFFPLLGKKQIPL